jgi:hypothetical protein
LAVQLAPLHEQLLFVGLLPQDRAVQEWQRLRTRIDVATLTDRRAVKLMPLVWRALVHAGVQDPQIADLEAMVHGVRASNELLVEQLRSALEVLQAAGVRVLGLKGVPLVLSYYLDWGLRPMSDADVLVDSADAPRTLDALRRAGWRPFREIPNVMGRPEASLVSPADDCVVDIHWRLEPWVSRNLSGRDPALWSAATPIDIRGQEMLAPAAHDLALHVLLHAYRSEWERVVRWVPDTVLILRNSGAAFDWDSFVRRVVTGRLVLPVREALEYVQTKFAAPVPESVTSGLHAVKPSRRELHKHKVASGREPEAHRFLGQWPRLRTHWARVTVNYPRALALRSAPAFLRARMNVEHLSTLPIVVAARRIRKAGARRKAIAPSSTGSSGSGQLGDHASEGT